MERQKTETPQLAKGAMQLATMVLMPVSEPSAPTSITRALHLDSVRLIFESAMAGLRAASGVWLGSELLAFTYPPVPVEVSLVVNFSMCCMLGLGVG